MMQRGEEFLECIVTLVGVYHSPLPGKVSRHRRVSADAMGSGNEGIEPRTPNPPRHARMDGDGDGERDPKKNDRSPLWSGRHIHTLRAESAQMTLRQGVVIGETGSLRVLDRTFH